MHSGGNFVGLQQKLLKIEYEQLYVFLGPWMSAEDEILSVLYDLSLAFNTHTFYNRNFFNLFILVNHDVKK